MDKKTYSFLMAVYAEENPAYFFESMKSMLEQSLMPDEIVVVKDGLLTDELEEVLLQYEEAWPEVLRVVNLKENVGLGLALNAGLDVCRNELVARMDSDDVSHRQRCLKQVEEFGRQPQLSILGSWVDEFDTDPCEIVSRRKVPLSHEDIVRFSKRRNPFNHPSVMYKKRDVLACGGYGPYRRNQDYDLFVRMLRKGYQAANLPESLVLFRSDASSLKKRKSWLKCKDNVVIGYRFLRNGYIGFVDFMLVSLGQVLFFVLPLPWQRFLSRWLLRDRL